MGTQNNSCNSTHFHRATSHHVQPKLRDLARRTHAYCHNGGHSVAAFRSDYNPKARRLIEEAGCRLLFLPPKGKHFNPIETVFSKVKTYIRNSYTASLAAREKRHRSEAETRMAIRVGCAKVTPGDLTGYFSYRGTRKCFEEMYDFSLSTPVSNRNPTSTLTRRCSSTDSAVV